MESCNLYLGVSCENKSRKGSKAGWSYILTNPTGETELEWKEQYRDPLRTPISDNLQLLAVHTALVDDIPCETNLTIFTHISSVFEALKYTLEKITINGKFRYYNRLPETGERQWDFVTRHIQEIQEIATLLYQKTIALEPKQFRGRDGHPLLLRAYDLARVARVR